MTDEKRGRVAAALKAVLNELDVELEWVNEEGARAFVEGDYRRIDQATARGKRIKAFGQSVADLQAGWEAFANGLAPSRQEALSHPPPSPSRPRQSAGTLREAYRVAILQALVDMGGKAKVAEVLTRVYEIIRDQLGEHDLATVPSGGIRWHQRAYGACYWMREQGLIRDDSPHGTWEISEAGRTLLAKARSDQ